MAWFTIKKACARSHGMQFNYFFQKKDYSLVLLVKSELLQAPFDTVLILALPSIRITDKKIEKGYDNGSEGEREKKKECASNRI